MTHRILAAFAAIAIAGCAGGAGTKSVIPARSAAATGNGKLTVRFSSVRHTHAARRAPRFVDPGGSDGVNIAALSSVDGSFFEATFNIPAGTVASGQATITIPLLMGSGEFGIIEFDATSGAMLAQTFAPTAYTVVPGVDLTLPTTTLNAVVGGIVVVEGDPITGTATAFSQGVGGTLGSPSLTCGTPKTETIFVVGSDALGNITAAGAATPGALPAAVLNGPSPSLASGGSSLKPSTLIPGAFTLVWDGGAALFGTFSAGDLFQNTDTEPITFGPAC